MSEKYKLFLKPLIISIFALLVVLVANTFVVSIHEVDGSSMEPTLESGNRLLIWKLPSTLSKVGIGNHKPSRGDIVVLSHFDGESNISYIKRVIALSGERIVVKNGSVMVYNDLNPNGFDPDFNTSYEDKIGSTFGDIDEVVPKDKIFVVGDNRVEGGSIDSRSGLGAVELKAVDGELWIKIFPVNKIGKVM